MSYDFSGVFTVHECFDMNKNRNLLHRLYIIKQKILQTK